LEKPKKTRAKPRKLGPTCKGFLEVEGYFCNIQKPQGPFCKIVAETLVDRYAWFDRKIGAHLGRWIKIKRLAAALAETHGTDRRRKAASGRGLAGNSPAKLEIKLSVAKRYGTNTKTKLGRCGTH
jgi:hypothetical protein